MSTSLARLERKLGYIKDQELMLLAHTHRSYAGRNNERLEFLGDAILNFVAGEALFNHFPQAREGQLSRLGPAGQGRDACRAGTRLRAW